MAPGTPSASEAIQQQPEALRVYVEDENLMGDGTLSMLAVPVPGSSTFTSGPVISGTPTNTDVSFDYTVAHDAGATIGLIWASVGTPAAAAALDLVSVKIATGMICGISGKAISTGALSETLTGAEGCSLERGVEYHLVVYVESSGNTGTLGAPVPFTVPTSNSFSSDLQASNATSEGVDIHFTAQQSGKAWGVVVEQANVASVNVGTIKAGTGAYGGVCLVADQAITAGAMETMSFTGCSLVMATTYKAFVYVEDGNGLGDGTLSGAVDVVLPASNVFQIMPYELRTPFPSSISYSFAPAYDGKVWAILTLSTDSRTPAEIKALHMASGGATCNVQGADVFQGMDFEIGNFTATPPGCVLTAGQSYKLHVYVEDDRGNNDGTVAMVTANVAAATVPNSFQESPKLVSALTGGGFDVTYRLAVAGRFHAIVTAQGAMVSVASLLAGTDAVGDTTCSFLPEVGVVVAATTLQARPGDRVQGGKEAIGAMSQKDAQVQKAKALHDAIRQMTEQTETLEAELSKLAAEKGQVEADLAASASRARELQAQLPQKAMELKQLEALEQQKEAEYMKPREAPFALRWMSLLTEPEEHPGTDYELWAYADDMPGGTWPTGAAATDGTLFGPMLLSIPLSNRLADPAQVTFVSGSTVTVEINTTAALGHAWLTVYPAATVVDVAAARNVSNALCGVAAVQVDSSSNAELSTTTCELVGGVEYQVAILVEDRNDRNDGELTVLSGSVVGAIPVSNSFTMGPRISSSMTAAGVWVTFSAQAAGRGNIYLLKDTAPAFVDIVSLRSGLPSDLMCSKMMMVSGGEQSEELSSCALTHSESYKVYVYVSDSMGGTTDGTLSAGLPATVVPGESNYFTQVPQLSGALTTSGFSVSFSVATDGVAWVIAIPAAEAASATAMTVTSGYSAICSSLGVALPSSGSHVLAVTGCSFIASWSYAVLVYVTNQAAGHDGALSPPVPLQITPSNDFAVLPYLTEVPTPDIVKASFMGTASTGRAWACLVRAENASDLTVQDVKSGCSGCSSGEAMLSNSEELEINMTGCGLEVGVEHRLVAYAEDNNYAGDGYMTMNLAVRVPTSNAFVSPAKIVDDMVTPYGCTVEYEVANAMGKVWGRVVNAGHASLVTMNVIKNNNPAISIGAGPCHLVDETKARGKHTITFDSCNLTKGATYQIYLYAEDMSDGGDGMLSEAITFSVPPSNWLHQSLELTSTPTAATSGCEIWEQSWTLPASRMNLSPELSIALQRITACNRSERLLMVVRDDLFKSLQAGQIAVAYAHEAWMQLEQLGADVMSIGRLVGFVDRDKLHKAFKDSKLLMRDRVVWQAMGRFRTILDTQVIMDYLAVIVNSDNTRLSQLRNAYYKVQSDVVAAMMENYPSWEKFARNVCGNVEDDDMQVVLMNLGLFVDLSAQNYYPSLMEVPYIVSDALSKTRPPSQTQLPGGTTSGPKIPSDAVNLQESLAELGRVLAYADFVDPVHEALKLSNKSSLVAIQHSIAAWARLRNDIDGSGVLSCDDGARKFRKLDSLLQEEILHTCYAFLGKDGAADFGLVDQVIREQCESKKDMPQLNIEALLTKLHTTHSHLQKAVLTELTCSENTDGVSFSFAGGVAVGRAWAQILLTKDVALATAADIKAGTYAMGVGSCRQDDVNVGMSALFWTLSGCSLTALVDYSVVLYIEDMAGMDDGQLSSVQLIVPSSVSNYFVETPSVLGNVTSDGVTLSFNAHAASGMAWGFVLEVGSASIASSTEAKLAQNSVGGAGCKPLEVPIDNTRQSMLFTDCDLVPGQTYRAVVYVEATATSVSAVDGVWQGVDLTVPLLEALEDPLARQFQDLQVQSGQDYVYHVRAVNFIGVGQPSPASAEIRAGNAPAAPGLPIIATRALTSLTVQWAPPSALGSQILSYRLFMSGPLDGGVYQEVYNGPDTAYTKAMLTTGTVYFFRVSAVNHNGEGWRSAAREAAACVLPSMPSNFTVKSRSTLGVTVEWSAPIADGGCPILSYVVTQVPALYVGGGSCSQSFAFPDEDPVLQDGVLAATQTHSEQWTQSPSSPPWALAVALFTCRFEVLFACGRAGAGAASAERVEWQYANFFLTVSWTVCPWALLLRGHAGRKRGAFADTRGVGRPFASKPLGIAMHRALAAGTWQGLMEELARRGIRTLAVDLRGHGESPLGDPKDFSPQQLAADVRATLKAAGVLEVPVVLVGHSMGGRIAMQYAADYPEDLSVLVIEDMDCARRIYPKLEGEELEKRQTFSRDFPSWEEAKKQLMSFGYDEERVESWWTSSTPRVYTQPGTKGVWSCINPHAQYLARQTVLNSEQGYECWQKIAALTQSGVATFPVHVCVAGPSGTVCKWEALPGGLHDMGSVLPALQLHEFPTADHSIHNTALQSLADFLEKWQKQPADADD
ncbi:Fndc3a [Symbiodinium sp. CCMP2592]|nr:Fndc3a [Symbiodinium sp. CCMP2592]